MQLEDAIARIVLVTPLSPDDMRGFLACTDEEKAVLVEAYRVSGKMPSKSAWAIVLDVLRLCDDAAGIIAPIAGAITSVFAVAAI